MDYSDAMFPKKRKLPGKKAKKKPSTMTRKLDKLVRMIVRERDGHCVTCGTSENLEVSHYLGRAKLGVRWDLRNCNLQCRKCHMEYHGGSPSYMKYLTTEYGESILDELYEAQTDWIRGGGASAAKKEDILSDLLDVWREYE